MAFSDKQRRALRAKLSHRHVKTRSNQGATISYLKGWHAVSEANRIFGYDSWDRQTQSPNCVWTQTLRGQVECFYSTKVRVTVRAGGTETVREGIGTGFGRSTSAELAHEIALKAAETDATKRALATFGNPFGLALYDKDQARVTRPKPEAAAKVIADAPPSKSAAPLVLRVGTDERSFGDARAFSAAVLAATAQLKSVDAVYAFWDANLSAFAALRERVGASEGDPVSAIVSALKGKAQALGRLAREPRDDAETETGELPFPKEKRIRNKEHLAFVASQPCLVCGRRPAHAHHIKFAQSRAMAMKVSDEFTVPLCSTHHDELHRTGDERAWWARHGILEPLKFAERLWAASSGRPLPQPATPPPSVAPIAQNGTAQPE